MYSVYDDHITRLHVLRVKNGVLNQVDSLGPAGGTHNGHLLVKLGLQVTVFKRSLQENQSLLSPRSSTAPPKNRGEKARLYIRRSGKEGPATGEHCPPAALHLLTLGRKPKHAHTQDRLSKNSSVQGQFLVIGFYRYVVQE